jgi:hypothetical protein
MNKKDIVSEIRKKQIYKMQYIFLKAINTRFEVSDETNTLFRNYSNRCIFAEVMLNERKLHTETFAHPPFGKPFVFRFCSAFDFILNTFFRPYHLTCISLLNMEKVNLKYRCVLYFNKLKHSLRQS